MKPEQIKELTELADHGNISCGDALNELLDEVERQAKEIAKLAQNTCVCNGALSDCDGMAYCRISVSLIESEIEVARLKRELENL